MDLLPDDCHCEESDDEAISLKIHDSSFFIEIASRGARNDNGEAACIGQNTLSLRGVLRRSNLGKFSLRLLPALAMTSLCGACDK
jgi:hypothetical protein